ncbi:MAG: hypothetical protein WCA49_23845 [Candidatus Sulfotelmatobacter sp.]
MQTDKELALQLIDKLEEMSCRELVYEAILDHSPETAPKWRRYFDHLMKVGNLREQIHQDYRSTREQVLNAPDLTSAVREMLEGIERIDPEDSGKK